jgi:S1-C subfamily serine protease
VGRVQRLDISGNATPLGLAFAIDEGVMVTSCHGVAPTAQLVVNLAPRLSPARVASVDEKLGLCKLAAEGVGSRPLTMSGAMPRPGETVYGTRVNAVGEVALIEGQVKRVVAEPNGNVIDSTIPVTQDRAGGPLLDVYGRVVAVASFSHADGKGRHMAMPAAWIADLSAPRAAPSVAVPTTPAAGPDATSSSSDSISNRVPKSARDIPPERLEKLEKAFRPPPTVPDDL